MELVDLSRVEVPTEWRLRFGDTADTLGAYLRQSRLQRHLTLEAVESRTKIKREFFDDLEHNNLSKWPASRFYRESYLRAYALAIGLDPHDVVDRYRAEFETTKTRSHDDQTTKTRSHDDQTTRARSRDDQTTKARSRDDQTPRVTVTSTGSIPPAAIPIVVIITFVIAFSLGRSYAPARASDAAPATNGVASGPSAPAIAPETEAPAAALATEPSTVPTITAEAIEGELVITSTPSGAHVTVNGIGRGPTPVRVQYLPVGTYTIRLVHEGHPVVTRQVTISPERYRARVAVTFDTARTTN